VPSSTRIKANALKLTIASVDYWADLSMVELASEPSSGDSTTFYDSSIGGRQDWFLTVSGIQPTADSYHIGNLLGAVQYWSTLQDTHECYYTVVDLHAFTVHTDPAVMHQRTLVSYAQLIASGIDPNKAAVFVQSHVPEHVELMWLFSCLTGFGEAGRMTQFKDKSSKAGADSTNVGLFTYPILQAADIALYQANLVPVGEDQRQHCELTRDLTERFNKRYGSRTKKG
jgi:tryptophanyl-tRNA synthetase